MQPTSLASSCSLIHNHPFLCLHHKSLVLLSGGSGLLGLVATELLLRLGLDGLVGLLDGRSTLDSGGAEVSAVRVLGDLVGNGLVGPGEGKSMVSRDSLVCRTRHNNIIGICG